MSGERRVGIAALCALIGIFVLLLLANAVSAEEKQEDNSRAILDEANTYQDINGSWEGDIDDTIKLTFANAGNTVDFDGIVVYNDYAQIASDGINWSIKNYYPDSISVETQGLIVNKDFPSLRYIGAFGDGGYSKFQYDVEVDLFSSQDIRGSWNFNVNDTSMAVYGLSAREVEYDVQIDSGVQWIRKQEDEEEHSWGTISSDSKAILALKSADIDVWEEIAALIAKQNPDGSFGSIEETSWAIIALSSSLDDETMERMERAMAWLRSQEFDNNEDLANAALAEDFYANALESWDPPDNTVLDTGKKKGESPLEPLYIISISIISAAALGYLLFARLEKDDALSGVRKDLYSYIEKHPGEHLANITKTFNLSSSSARYHLSVLEGMDQIVSHKNGKYKRFYINKNGYSKYTNGNGYKHIMSALKNVTARRIVKFIISNPNANQKSVSNALNIHPSTVNWHAERLRDAEVLSKSKKGKEIVYSLNEDVQVRKVIRILEGIPA
jgi:predicted transcriptional regulator